MGRSSVRRLHLLTALRINVPLLPGEDIYVEPDTSKIATHLIEKLLNSASGKDKDGNLVLTFPDLSKALSQRQADSKANNPEFSRNLLVRFFGFGKLALQLSIALVRSHVLSYHRPHSCAAIELVFGGKVDDLRPFLLEERIVDGWVPENKERYGITMGAFNVASAKIGFRTKTVPATVTTTSLLSV